MKETKKQIKAQIVNEVRRQFDQKLQQKTEAIELWQKKYIDLNTVHRNVSKECQLLRDENDLLKQKVAQYEEWVERMQEFCNLPEEERKQAFTTYMDGIKSRMERDEEMKALGSFFGHYMSMLF